MAQNLLSLTLSDEDVSAVNTALADIETRLSGLIALDNDTRRQITKMGGKSEAFVRQTLTVLRQNPDIVPPALGLAEAQADLVALDRLRPLLHRLQRLVERASDSEMALGSDLMTVSLEGYGVLKVSGRMRGLEGAAEALSARFARTTRRAEPAPAA